MEDTSASPETVFPNLPEDALMEILSLLPAKSLIRFRSVCKYWYSLIQNPSFVSKHHNRSKTLNRNESLLVFRSLRTRDEQTQPEIWNVVESGISISLVDNQTLTPFSHIDLGLWSPSWKMIGGSHFGGLRVSGHCNGIICINDADDINHIILCNPATREFKTLPLPSFSYPQHTTAKCRTVGFGYDPISDDYKVVKILVLYEVSPDGRSCRCYYKTQIYNLSSDSWREIDAFRPVTPVCYFPSFEIFFNGAFHWHGVDERFDWESIMAFDMKDEVFRQMEFPDCCCYPFEDGKSRILSVWNDSLALVLYDYSEPPEMFVEIWVMKEYGVKESWTKEFVSEPLIGMNGPLTIWKDSELLLEGSNGQLVSINLYDHGIRDFEVMLSRRDYKLFCLQKVLFLSTDSGRSPDTSVLEEAHVFFRM